MLVKGRSGLILDELRKILSGCQYPDAVSLRLPQ